MNRVNFKDVAHLYLGCILQRGGIITAGLLDAANKAEFDAYADFKPILRPISDMKEQEMKELYPIVFGKSFHGDNITLRDAGGKQERWVLWSGVDRLFIYKDGDIGADSDLHYFGVHQASVTVFLLSNGFDLFGLIESGQAIDKTKLLKS